MRVTKSTRMQVKNKKYCLFACLLFLVCINTIAQTDTLFWFATPYATLDHVSPHQADLTLTATDTSHITTVKISHPLNPGKFEKIVKIDPAVSLTKNISFTSDTINLFSNNIYNSVENSSLLVQADHEITAYYEIHRTGNNPDVFSLKGTNALGTDFWTPFQTRWNNHNFDTDPAFSQIIIVATENNTQITVRFDKPAYGYAANVDHVITLNRGQTFMFVPAVNSSLSDGSDPSYKSTDRLTGTHITSNKPIAVTIGDDSVQKQNAYDFIGDQLVPVKNIFDKTLIGYEYIVMKGKVDDDNGNEKVYILATKNSTTITVTKRGGTPYTLGPINAGKQTSFDLLGSSNEYYAHISATEPVYVFHISGFGDEIGGAVLPTIDGCTGSLSVSFVRSKAQNFYLNLMVKEDAIDSFYISVNNSSFTHFLSASDFERAGSSSWFVLKDAQKGFGTGQIPVGVVTRVINTKNVFHLGMINGINSGGGCIYGYFSDYNELEAGAHVEDQGSVFQTCGADSIQLIADGGLSYQWTPTDYLDDPTSRMPILSPPPGGFNQVYKVEIEQPCNGMSEKQVWVYIPPTPDAFFSLNKNKGCAPLRVEFNDASSGSDLNLFNLDLGDGSGLISSLTPIDTFHVYENNTDTAVSYIIAYTVGNADGCMDYITDTVVVFPKVTSSFDLINPGDTAGCHPLDVGFHNTSTGNTDTYYWDFGDGSSNTDTLIYHTYTNIGSIDSSYYVKLIATSPYPYLCRDTSDLLKIRVFPYINSVFAIDSTTICSPANIRLNPTGSVGVDTFFWSYYDIHGTIIDSTFKKTNKNPFIFYHNDNSQPNPDTIFVGMNAVNKYGCHDTALTRKLVIYPEVHSVFSTDKTTICDSVIVQFTNNSVGYNLLYHWDFGNGTSKTDSSSSSFNRIFLNRSNHDTIYDVYLTTTSDFNCTDTSSIGILVHPYVNAEFAVDYSSTCSPMNVNIINQSHHVQNYSWRFGDGSTSASPGPTLTHTYINTLDVKDTTYTLRLNVTSAEGCTDSLKTNITLAPRVIADFQMSDNQGCNPFKITFHNTSKGSNLVYKWKFGNSIESSINSEYFDKTFEHNSSNDSLFQVSLTTTNQFGCDSSISKPVTLYAFIDADFLVARSDSCSPFTIDISNSSPAGVTSYNWNFGDGSPGSTSSEPSHTYTNTSLSARTDKLRLVVKNNHDCYDTLIRPITIYPEINADFEIDTFQGCQPLAVNFLNNNTNIIPGTYFYWTFDDGSFSSDVNPVHHTYKNINNYALNKRLLLEATSQYGCYDSISKAIKVYPYIFSKFAIDKAEVCSDEKFVIDRSASSGGISTYHWDFNNDGTVDATTPNAVFDHSYTNNTASSETKTIRLTVLNTQGCDTSWTQNIAVHPQVNAVFELDDYAPCYPYNTIVHNISQNKGIVATKFSWNLGDGSVSSSSNDFFEHKFNNFDYYTDKPYTITLIAQSDFDCSDTTTKDIIIHPKPNADFTFPLNIDCPPFTVPFANASRGTNMTYTWGFDDNSSINTETSPTHVFYNNTSSIVERNIELIATTAFGCKDTIYKPINVYPKVTVDFEASTWEGCGPLIVDFQGSAINQNNVTWYVDGAAFSTVEDPEYRFVNNTSGNIVHDIKFKATSIYNCYADTTKPVTVFPSPIAEFIPDPVLQDHNVSTDINPVTFTNFTNHQASPIWEYYWDYGDGTTDSNADGSFTKDYTIWGDINNGNILPVKFVAWNKNNPECRDTVIHNIIINPPIPKIDLADDVAGCVPFTVEFSATTKYIYEDSYQWEFGFNGAASNESEPSFEYTEPGFYITKLVVQGDGGTNWDYKKITVYPKPDVDFAFSPELVMEASSTEPETPVRFFNNTRLGETYIWDFGDNSEFSNEKEPWHVYQDTGHYYITLYVTSAEGCQDTLTSTAPIIVEGARQLDFPTAFIVSSSGPAEEYYNPNSIEPAVFRPVAHGVEKYRLEIYNRWGELIFVSEDVNKGWNGYVNGKLMKQDVYIWKVKATFTDGKPLVRAGDVTLLVKP